MFPAPTLTLNNGTQMPVLGLGVFQTPPEETIASVHAALGAGYRLIDTAAAYGNEREVGRAIATAGVPREQVFIETKVWISDYGYEATLRAFDKAACKLDVDVLDLLLLHHPMPSRFDLTIESYRALEHLLDHGAVRAIGVSNFMPDHLARLIAHTRVIPAVNQIEIHPYFAQTAVQRANAAHGIVSQAWSPIGGITSYFAPQGGRTFDDPTIKAIAARHRKTPAQVMLSWHLHHGRAVIPKSASPRRIAENADIFDFTLSDADVAAIDTLERGGRRGPDPANITLEAFGFAIPDA